MTAAHANVQVRNSSLKLCAELYKHMGEAVRAFLGDVKESTMKLIDAEFGKVTPYKKGEFTSSRVAKGEAAEAPAEPVASLADALPREDISK